MALPVAEALGAARGKPFLFDGALQPRNQNVGSFYIGTGAPSSTNPAPYPRTGSGYWRTDTPTVANQRLYICTVGGATPTWVGIL